jgi:hypothetical protein
LGGKIVQFATVRAKHVKNCFKTEVHDVCATLSHKIKWEDVLTNLLLTINIVQGVFQELGIYQFESFHFLGDLYSLKRQKTRSMSKKTIQNME